GTFRIRISLSLLEDLLLPFGNLDRPISFDRTLHLSLGVIARFQKVAMQNFLGLGPPDFLGWGPPDFLKLDPPDFLGLGPPPREPSAMTVWPCTVVGFARGGRGRNGAEEVHGGSICRDQAAAVGGSRLARDCASVEMLATHGSRSARWHACLARPT